jgi:hypothetical protein
VNPASSGAPARIVKVGFVGAIGRACFSDLMLCSCPGLDMAYQGGSRAMLLAGLGADELDIVVYPGAPLTGLRTALLEEDRIEVAFSPEHPLAHGATAGGPDLTTWTVLLPADGAGDFRRLCGRLVALPGRIVELPLRDIDTRLRDRDGVALISRGQRAELKTRVVTRPLTPRASFSVWVSWSPQLDPGLQPDLAAVLRPLCASLSSPCVDQAKPRRERADDDTGGVGGGLALG